MFDEELYDNDEEVDIIAHCEDCGKPIYEDSRTAYIDENYNYFCDLDCVLNYYGVSAIGD